MGWGSSASAACEAPLLGPARLSSQSGVARALVAEAASRSEVAAAAENFIVLGCFGGCEWVALRCAVAAWKVL